VFHKTARNFNPDVALAGDITIVEADEIVEVGEIDPDEIQLPGIFVNRVIQGVNEQKRIEKLTLNMGYGVQIPAKTEADRHLRTKIAQRAAKEIKHDTYVNLGIGMPTICANYIADDLNVYFHSENGMLGMGPYPRPGQEDPDLINAGKETVTCRKGGVFLKSSDAFLMVRGGHLDLSIIGGLQASQRGDLANWIIPGKMAKGMGGAMDLVAATKRIVVVMSHASKHGEPKILEECSLPLTGKACIKRLITDLLKNLS
jgi:3-oxoacid CoA-transferase